MRGMLSVSWSIHVGICIGPMHIGADLVASVNALKCASSVHQCANVHAASSNVGVYGFGVPE